MDEQRLQEFEAWFAEAACSDDCDEHDEAALASLIAEIRRLRQEEKEAEERAAEAQMECNCAVLERDAALAERDEARAERDDWAELARAGRTPPDPNEPWPHRAVERIHELDAALTEARRVLKATEWGNGDGWCRTCRGFDYEGHTADCALAAVLAQDGGDK